MRHPPTPGPGGVRGAKLRLDFLHYLVVRRPPILAMVSVEATWGALPLSQLGRFQ